MIGKTSHSGMRLKNSNQCQSVQGSLPGKNIESNSPSHLFEYNMEKQFNKELHYKKSYNEIAQLIKSSRTNNIYHNSVSTKHLNSKQINTKAVRRSIGNEFALPKIENTSNVSKLLLKRSCVYSYLLKKFKISDPVIINPFINKEDPEYLYKKAACSLH